MPCRTNSIEGAFKNHYAYKSGKWKRRELEEVAHRQEWLKARTLGQDPLWASRASFVDANVIRKKRNNEVKEFQVRKVSGSLGSKEVESVLLR